MSRYTTELRYLIEENYPLFDFDYPIFDVKYKPVLEQNIINHYYYREIGVETAGKFKHYLKTKMLIVMPYYNQLYESIGLVTKENYNRNLATTEEHSRNLSSIATNEGTSENKSNSIFSDTPQSKILNIDYATTLNEDTQNGNDQNTGEVNSTESYLTTVTGSGGMRYNADILMEWRKSFINVDKQIIDELKDLFMNIY